MEEKASLLVWELNYLQSFIRAAGMNIACHIVSVQFSYPRSDYIIALYDVNCTSLIIYLLSDVASF